MVSFVGQWKTELNDCTLFGPAKQKRTFLPHIPPEKIMPRHINRRQFVRNATALASAGLWLTSESERASQWNSMAKKE